MLAKFDRRLGGTGVHGAGAGVTALALAGDSGIANVGAQAGADARGFGDASFAFAFASRSARREIVFRCESARMVAKLRTRFGAGVGSPVSVSEERSASWSEEQFSLACEDGNGTKETVRLVLAEEAFLFRFVEVDDDEFVVNELEEPLDDRVPGSLIARPPSSLRRLLVRARSFSFIAFALETAGDLTTHEPTNSSHTHSCSPPGTPSPPGPACAPP